MKLIFQLAVVLVTLAVWSEARVYTRCELAKNLLKHSFFTRAKLSDWVCLVEKESTRNSKAVGPPNTDGSRDYGLFQINDRYWCGANGVGGDCKISCQSLLSDDGVGVAVKCVRLIYKRHGFDAWYGWQRGCLNKQLPDLRAECGI